MLELLNMNYPLNPKPAEGIFSFVCRGASALGSAFRGFLEARGTRNPQKIPQRARPPEPSGSPVCGTV